MLLFITIQMVSYNTLAQNQAVRTNSCETVRELDVIFVLPVMILPDVEEIIGTVELQQIVSKADALDRNSSEEFLQDLSHLYSSYSIGLVTDEKSCNFLNAIVEESNIRETLPEPMREVYFKIREHYAVMFLYKCENCVQLGKRPIIYLINETGGVKEVKWGE